MHSSSHPWHHAHAASLIVVLAVAGAALGSLLAPSEVVAPTAVPRSTCAPTAGPSGRIEPTTCPTESAGRATVTPTTEATASPGATARATPRPSPSSAVAPSARPTARPTARPSPRPTARPTPRPSPSSPPLRPSRLVRHGPRTSGAVALTFDMGGRVGDALEIMGWLVANEVHASVFMTGAMADSPQTDAGRRVLSIVQANPALFTLGNHSYTHADFRTLSADEIATELRRTERAIAPHCEQQLTPFFRPPSGGYDDAVLAAVGAAGYRLTVTWDVDTIDWRPIANDPPGPTADQIVAKVLGNAQGGSIVLMHLGGYETLRALPRIVAGLKQLDLELVTLDELL